MILETITSPQHWEAQLTVGEESRANPKGLALLPNIYPSERYQVLKFQKRSCKICLELGASGVSDRRIFHCESSSNLLSFWPQIL